MKFGSGSKRYKFEQGFSIPNMISGYFLNTLLFKRDPYAGSESFPYVKIALNIIGLRFSIRDHSSFIPLAVTIFI
ncbi:MAG TPA: hypothetical protein DD671_03710, partial [Balneolaceae bacterium]|nr:hypothetical protein [Balneolaceae bacterium]